MRKFFLSLVALLVLSCPVYCQINLSKKDRIANSNEGFCSWCCIESLGRYHKIESLYGLKDRRTKASDFKKWDANKKEWIDEPYVWVDQGNGTGERVPRNVGDYVDMRNKLNEARVKYTIQNYGNFDTQIIKDSVKNKLGCMIVVKWWKEPNSKQTHALIVQNCDDEKLTLFDPNDIEYNYTVSWNWMNTYWTGYALVIEGSK